jgi:NAD(P)H-flavin reductase
MEAHPVEAMLTAPFRVSKNRKETSDTHTLELTPNDGGEAPEWQPGQFMMLYVFGVGEIPVSISGDPTRRGALTHTVRAVGAVSRAICRAKPGSHIGARGPFGNSWPAERFEGHDIVMAAGGVGLAPLRPALYRILRNRGRYGRVYLLAGARTPDILLYSREVPRWKKGGIDVRTIVDTAPRGWSGPVGPITMLVPQTEFNASRTVALIVGPEIMMRLVAQALARRGVAGDHLYVSMERNMKCAIGFCGHCQLGPAFICKDGPVFPWSQLAPWLAIRNL